jgi:hypothetical protein
LLQVEAEERNYGDRDIFSKKLLFLDTCHDMFGSFTASRRPLISSSFAAMLPRFWRAIRSRSIRRDLDERRTERSLPGSVHSPTSLQPSHLTTLGLETWSIRDVSLEQLKQIVLTAARGHLDSVTDAGRVAEVYCNVWSLMRFGRLIFHAASQSIGAPTWQAFDWQANRKRFAWWEADMFLPDRHLKLHISRQLCD